MLCRLSRACFRSPTCRPLRPGENLLPHRFRIWECPPSVYHPYLWGSRRAAGTVYYDGVQTSVRLERFDSRLRLHLALRRWKPLASLFDIPAAAARKEVTKKSQQTPPIEALTSCVPRFCGTANDAQRTKFFFFFKYANMKMSQIRLDSIWSWCRRSSRFFYASLIPEWFSGLYVVLCRTLVVLRWFYRLCVCIACRSSTALEWVFISS